MNVMYAADDNYAEIMIVSILSLYKYNKNLSIAVMDNGISEKKRKIINDIASTINLNITFFQGKVIEGKFCFALNTDRGSIAQFARLFIGNVIPEKWNRVLYLDCDTLIRESLDELYNVDMKNMVVAGVEDAFGLWHWRLLGLKKKDTYINSGVMVINLKLWREQEIEKKIEEFILQKKGRIIQGDQGIINAVLKNKILILPVRYNMVTYNFDFTYNEMSLYRKPYKYYSEKEVAEAKINPALVHFTSSFASMRPWENIENSHSYKEEWLSYYLKLGYEVKNKNKLSKWLYERLPHHFTLLFIGILHAYIKPMIYWIGN